MLQVLVGYTKDLAIDIRWLVIDGDGEFFRITKRVHNRIHGQPGDGGALGAAERAPSRRRDVRQRGRASVIRSAPVIWCCCTIRRRPVWSVRLLGVGRTSCGDRISASTVRTT